MCRGSRKRDITTMVTYSHATTPLGQSEPAYYLSYFIKKNVVYLGRKLCLIFRYSSSGESRVEDQGPEPPFLFWVEIEEILEGRKPAGQTKQPPPLFSSPCFHFNVKVWISPSLSASSKLKLHLKCLISDKRWQELPNTKHNWLKKKKKDIYLKKSSWMTQVTLPACTVLLSHLSCHW